MIRFQKLKFQRKIGEKMLRISSVFRCVFLVMLSVNYCYSWGSKEVFEKYPNDFFVETGTHNGGGVQNALDAGFQYVRNIELAPHHCSNSKKRFKKNKNVQIHLGDSSCMLGEIIKDIDRPITFWLDGHYSAGDTAQGLTNSPILLELDQIATHPIKTHTILIDDVRCFGTWDFDYVTLDEVVAKILEINPNYCIHFEDGYQENDILVAFINETSTL